jgi:hypothetical protein
VQVAVDLVRALVVNATWQQLIESHVISDVFPKLMTLLLTTPNHSTLEMGVSCLLQFVRVAQHHLVTDWSVFCLFSSFPFFYISFLSTISHYLCVCLSVGNIVGVVVVGVV